MNFESYQRTASGGDGGGDGGGHSGGHSGGNGIRATPAAARPAAAKRYHRSVLRAILFDFNGVLVDDEPIHFALFQRVLGEEAVELTREEYYRDYLALDDRACFTAALSAAGKPPDAMRLARLITRKATYYRDWIRREGHPFFPGAAELIAATLGAGHEMGLVSGALRQEIEDALDQLEVRARFKVVISAEDVEHSKPHPEGYRKALAALNGQPPLPQRLYHPHEVLAIEDTPGGLTAAAQAGLRTLAVAHTYPAEQLRDAEHVLPTLAEIDLAQLQKLYA
jgi:HAD superfamily hydrolase (TIGR01509 family)